MTTSRLFTEAVLNTLGERAKNGVSFGLSIFTPSGNLAFEEFFHGERNTYPASSIKTLIALAVLRRIDQRTSTLEDALVIDQPNAAEESVDWNPAIYGPGKALSIRQLLTDMITVSNNIATNQLIDLSGKAAINEVAELVHAPSLKIVRKLYSRVPAEPDNPNLNCATARGLTELYREIATGRLGLLQQTGRAFLIELLRSQKRNDRLNAYFPAGTPFFHKTGGTSQSSSDAGFYYLPNGTIAVLVGLQDFRDFTTLARIGKDSLELSHRISKEVFL